MLRFPIIIIISRITVASPAPLPPPQLAMPPD
jgi:hypothetical protein